MSVVKWAAVAVTALMGLMNLGLLLEQDAAAGLRVIGAVLGVIAIVAVVGFARGSAWGRPALIGVGILNVLGSIVGAFVDVEGWPIGLVVAALGAVLGAVHRSGTRNARPVAGGAAA